MEMRLTKAFGELDPRKHLRTAEVDDLLGHVIPARRQRQRALDDIIAMNDGTEKRMEQVSFLISLGAPDQVAAELILSRKHVRKTNRLE